MHKNKIVLFDIDHTIFDTESYIDKLYNKLSQALGYTNITDFRKIANELYSNIRRRTKFLPPKYFLDKIHSKSKSNLTIQELNDLFWDKDLFESSIYSDVDETVRYLANENFTIGIFSTGDKDHQKFKIESLTEHFSKEHIHISEDKFKIIKSTLPGYNNYNCYLLDDLPEILHEAKTHNQKLFTVLIKRKGNKRLRPSPPNFKPDAIITNLDEFIDIIKNKS